MYGATGWIGGLICELLDAQGVEYVRAKARIDERESCARCVGPLLGFLFRLRLFPLPIPFHSFVLRRLTVLSGSSHLQQLRFLVLWLSDAVSRLFYCVLTWLILCREIDTIKPSVVMNCAGLVRAAALFLL